MVMGARRLLYLSMLLIGAGLLARLYYSSNFDADLSRSIQRNVEREFSSIDKEAHQLLSEHLAPSAPMWDEARHFFIHVDQGRIAAWNRTYFVPDLTIANSDDSIYFVSSSRGDFLLKRWTVTKGSSLICILKLTDRFPIINNFLSSQWEPSIFPVRDVVIMTPEFESGIGISLSGRTLFKISIQKSDTREGTLSFLLLLFGILFLLLALWTLAREAESKFSCDMALAILFFGLLAIRIGMIAGGIPALYWPADIFDPKRFASSSLNASLGDLLFNAMSLAVPMTYLFLKHKKFRFVGWALQCSGPLRFGIGVLCLLACYYALLFPFDFIEAIYHNSTLSLDSIQSLSYDSIHVVAVISVLLGCVASFMFFHVFFSLATSLFGNRQIGFFTGILLASMVFIIQFYLSDRNLWTNLLLAMFFCSVVRITEVHKDVSHMSFRLFIYLIFSLGVYSLQNAWAVRTFFTERQVKDQFRFAKDFLTERDVLGEYLLDQARQHIQNDQFIQTRMSSLFLQKTVVVDKIRRVFLNNYFDRYEISIRTRAVSQTLPDSLDSQPMGPGQVGLNDFLPTGYAGISYKNASEGTAIKRYHMVVPIQYQRPVGWVELDLALKRVIPENVYPELLVDNRFNQIYRNRDFSYAVYTKGKLVNSFGPFNYERDFRSAWLEDPGLFTSGIPENGYHHIAVEDAEGSVAVVSASTYDWFYFITNFSFWFILGLVLLFGGQGIMGILSYVRGVPENYTARIQLFVFLAFLLPVLAVSITILTLIGRSNEEGIKKDFIEKATVISRRIGGLISSDSVKTGNDTTLETWIEENATSSKTDISVYSPEGKLIATSQPALFDDKLVSRLMDREGWKRIALQQESQTVTNEELGKLQYSCAYAAVLSPETGQLMAIVGLPFFESATFLQKSQSLIFSNILIVFVVVFIFFSVLSFWASNSLTYPIRFITRTLGQTTLNGQNKPLEWKSSDEIGTLVKEYNRMVENLEESKKALAQSEKESAWREMAKQVAHEIKNPLTPMKLILQQMEMALNSGSMSAEKSQKSVGVLLKQVNILNEIAASFSNFARMPPSSPRIVDLNTLIQETIHLFGAETSGNIRFARTGTTLRVSVDPTSFSRAISNLVINALQAKQDGQQVVEIDITTSFKDGVAVTIIRDNGKGMSPEVQEKVFQPHFTTKESGSGLGLAMTKQIILQAQGKIWFESAIGLGTTFYVEVPMVA